MKGTTLTIFLLVAVIGFASSNPVLPYNPDTSNIPKCLQPQASGLCLAYFPSFYYNYATGTCESFIYGGCHGNSNRFFTVEDCERECKGFQPEINKDFKLTFDSDEKQSESIEDESESIQDESGSIADGSEAVKDESGSIADGSESVNDESGSIADGSEAVKDESGSDADGSESVKDESGSESDESDSSRDESVEKRSESGAGESDPCSLPAVKGPCRAFFTRFYFNGKECESFIYGGCRGNKNNFQTLEECNQKCSRKVTERNNENPASEESQAQD